MATASEALAAKTQHATTLLAQKEVVGIGVGFLAPNDESQGSAVILYVQKDLAPSTLSSFPNSLALGGPAGGSVPVRIEVSGAFYANTSPDTSKWAFERMMGHPEYSRRIRPVRPGYSVGTVYASGTAGLIVIDSADGQFQTYIASNNHVLNSNNDDSYDETIQAGGADGGMSGRDKIGRAGRFIKIQNSNNYLDAATAVPDAASLLDSTYPTVGRLPGHYKQYRVGWTFYKVGRTTGPVRGRVDSVHTDLPIDYGSYGGLGTVGFKDQTVILSDSPVSLPGDSGSIWLKDDDNYACAVNYAGSDDGRRSISFPFNWFADIFKVLVAVPPLLRGNIVMVETAEDRALYSGVLSSQQLAGIRVESVKTS